MIVRNIHWYFVHRYLLFTIYLSTINLQQTVAEGDLDRLDIVFLEVVLDRFFLANGNTIPVGAHGRLTITDLESVGDNRVVAVLPITKAPLLLDLLAHLELLELTGDTTAEQREESTSTVVVL